MPKPTYDIPKLPLAVDVETIPVFRALADAHRFLAEVKGRASSIPNQGILIDTLTLQEAKASSEVENIVTTQDELFKADVFPDGPGSVAAKEVERYRAAIRHGHEKLLEANGLITSNTLIELYRLLKKRNDGFRSVPGTELRNDTTGETVYVPPQDYTEIVTLMGNLEAFVNDDDLSDLDPLIKMAIIHHQFESIHPFPDGNGRIGRILNVMYLTKCGLLDIPILYLSRHITQTKSEYYRLLQSVRDDGAWEDWILYMLRGVADTSKATLYLIEEIRTLMSEYKHEMRRNLPKLYSQDLLNNLFRHPYTRIEFVENDLGVSRQTASKYLDKLAEFGFVIKHTAGRNNYYINFRLVQMFMEASKNPTEEDASAQIQTER